MSCPASDKCRAVGQPTKPSPPRTAIFMQGISSRGKYLTVIGMECDRTTMLAKRRLFRHRKKKTSEVVNDVDRAFRRTDRSRAPTGAAGLLRGHRFLRRRLS